MLGQVLWVGRGCSQYSGKQRSRGGDVLGMNRTPERVFSDKIGVMMRTNEGDCVRRMT